MLTFCCAIHMVWLLVKCVIKEKNISNTGCGVLLQLTLGSGVKRKKTIVKEMSLNVDTMECVKTTIWTMSVCVQPLTSTQANGL